MRLDPDSTGRAPIYELDARSLKEIAQRVQDSGVAKARRPVPAGAYIGFAAFAYTPITGDTTPGFAWSRAVYRLGTRAQRPQRAQ